MAASRRQTLVFTLDSTIFLFLLSFRILNALTIRTFFQPDEYFQSLEPAWNLVFPDAGWITWEWRHGLRSILHPLLFAGLYQLVIPIFPASALPLAPKILGAFFAAIGDYCTARLAGRLFGSDEGWTALILSTMSAWNWFAATRSFANSLETAVTVAALGEWWGGSQRLAFAGAAVACVLRPTNALVWAVLGAFKVLRTRRVGTVVEAGVIGAVVFGINAVLDRWYYEAWTLPALTFLRFNVVQDLAVFYGRNVWHYYISQGWPLLLTAYLPVAVRAVYEALVGRNGPGRELAITSVLVTAVYSLIAHKEVRFVYPLLPMVHALAAKTVRKSAKWMLPVLVALNVPIAWYAATVHQRGVVDVVNYLGRTESSSVGFLMPCHSTPWVSSIGRTQRERWWALTCEPPIDMTAAERTRYVDEADRFYEDPKRFMGDIRELPEKMVIFAQLEETFVEVLGRDYTQCWRGFNSHFHDDWRRRGDVVVYCIKEALE